MGSLGARLGATWLCALVVFKMGNFQFQEQHAILLFHPPPPSMSTTPYPQFPIHISHPICIPYSPSIPHIPPISTNPHPYHQFPTPSISVDGWSKHPLKTSSLLKGIPYVKINKQIFTMFCYVAL